MSFKRTIFIIPILLIGIFISAQTIRVETEKRVKDDFFEKSQSILPIYKYTSDSIQPYSKFGLEVDPNQAWYKIKNMPNMKGCRDTGYTYIYFAGADNTTNQGYILCMVGNYTRSRRTVYFYIDRNNDFDFTNDGKPDSLLNTQYNFEIDLENINAPGATYGMKLSRFKYGENVRYKNMLTEHYKTHSGQKKFTSINYCYRTQRYNSIAAHVKNGTDSFTVGIKDVNVNGIYNESCIDKLYVGPYKSQIVSDDLYDMTPTLEKNSFEWGGKKYRFESIESTGNFIELVEDKNAVLTNKLEMGKKAPNFTYFNVLNFEHELKEYKKKEVYIYFWDKDNMTSEDTTYLSKLNNEFEQSLKLITLNHGDEPKQVRITYYYDKIKWPMGYSNSEIAQKYFLEDVNRGYYLGKKCVLKNDNITPKELYLQLSSNQN